MKKTYHKYTCYHNTKVLINCIKKELKLTFLYFCETFSVYY